MASIIFGVVFSFGLNADKIPLGQMASGLENISGDLLSGLEILGLNDEDQNIHAASVIESATIDFNFETLEGENGFQNVISGCNFHSDQGIEGETCVVCTLYEGTILEHEDLASGMINFTNYTPSTTKEVLLDQDTFSSEDANSVFKVNGVKLEVCDPGGDGCAVAFWKNNEWAWAEIEPIPIDPETDFRLVFEIAEDDEFEITLTNGTTLTNPTLMQALDTQGVGMNQLARESVAALLNSESSFDYPLTSTDVVTSFRASFTAGEIDASVVSAFVEMNAAEGPV